MQLKFYQRFFVVFCTLLFCFYTVGLPVSAAVSTITFTDMVEMYNDLDTTDIYDDDDLEKTFTYTTDDGTSYTYDLTAWNSLSSDDQFKIITDYYLAAEEAERWETVELLDPVFDIYKGVGSGDIISVSEAVYDVICYYANDMDMDSDLLAYYTALFGNPVDCSDSFMDFEQYNIQHSGGGRGGRRGVNSTFEGITIGDYALEFVIDSGTIIHAYTKLRYTDGSFSSLNPSDFDSYRSAGFELCSSNIPYVQLTANNGDIFTSSNTYVLSSDGSLVLCSVIYDVISCWDVYYYNTSGVSAVARSSDTSTSTYGGIYIDTTYRLMCLQAPTIIGFVSINDGLYLAVDFNYLYTKATNDDGDRELVAGTLYFDFSSVTGVSEDDEPSVNYNDDEPYGTLINNNGDIISNVYISYDDDTSSYYYTYTTDEGDTCTYYFNDDNSTTIDGTYYYYNPDYSTYSAEYLSNYLNCYYNYYYNTANTFLETGTSFDSSGIVAALKSIYDYLSGNIFNALYSVNANLVKIYNNLSNYMPSFVKHFNAIENYLEDISNSLGTGDALSDEEADSYNTSWLELIALLEDKFDLDTLSNNIDVASSIIFGERVFSTESTLAVASLDDYSTTSDDVTAVQVLSVSDGTTVVYSSSMPSLSFTYGGVTYNLFSSIYSISDTWLDTIKGFVELILYAGFFLSLFRSLPAIIGNISAFNSTIHSPYVDNFDTNTVLHRLKR